MKRQPKQDTKAEQVKTTIRLPRSLWDAARHRAIDEGTDIQDLVGRAIEQYLRKGGRA